MARRRSRRPAARCAVADRAQPQDPEHRQPVLGAGAHRRRRRRRVDEQASRAASASTARPRGRVGEHAGVVDDEQRPRAEAAVGQPRRPRRPPPRRPSSPRRGRGRAAASDGRGRAPRATVGRRQLDRRDELAEGQRGDPGPDEERRRAGPSGCRRARPRSRAPRRPGAPAPCPRPARRCRCCRPASRGSGSAPSRRPRPPRRAPGTRAGSRASRGDRRHRRPAPRCAAAVGRSRIAASSSGDALDVDDDRRRQRPVAQPDDQVRAAGQQPGVRPVLARAARRPRRAARAARRRTAACGPRRDRSTSPATAGVRPGRPRTGARAPVATSAGRRRSPAVSTYRLGMPGASERRRRRVDRSAWSVGTSAARQARVGAGQGRGVVRPRVRLERPHSSAASRCRPGRRSRRWNLARRAPAAALSARRCPRLHLAVAAHLVPTRRGHRVEVGRRGAASARRDGSLELARDAVVRLASRQRRPGRYGRRRERGVSTTPSALEPSRSASRTGPGRPSPRAHRATVVAIPAATWSPDDVRSRARAGLDRTSARPYVPDVMVVERRARGAEPQRRSESAGPAASSCGRWRSSRCVHAAVAARRARRHRPPLARISTARSSRRCGSGRRSRSAASRPTSRRPPGSRTRGRARPGGRSTRRCP